MKLQLAHKDDMQLPDIMFSRMSITATGVEIIINGKTFLIGCSYIESFHVQWNAGTVWMGITSENETQMLWGALMNLTLT